MALCTGQQHAAVGIARKLVVARHEVGVVQPQSAGHQAAHVDLRARAKQHAIGVEDEDLPIGRQAAQQVAGAAAGDAVQGNGLGVGLVKDQAFVSGGGELEPVNGQALAGLGDGGGSTLRDNLAAACAYQGISGTSGKRRGGLLTPLKRRLRCSL